MNAEHVVAKVWQSIHERDWTSLAELLAPEVTLEYPGTDERIVGAANVVAVNAQYPEGWSIDVLRILGDGERVASEVEVPMEGVGTFRVASFWTVRDGLVIDVREYWVLRGADQAPAWRKPYTLAGDLVEP